MAHLFAVLEQHVAKSSIQAPEAPFNSEMDDLEIPEGESMPTTQELLDVTRKIDVIAQQMEKTGETGEPDDIETLQEDPLSGDSGAAEGGDSPEDLGDDILSVATDVNRQGEEIGQLRAQLDKLGKKVDIVVQIDDRIRKLEAALDNLTTSVHGISQRNADVQKSFSLYQTNTSKAIADVERRAAEKQLRLAPKLETADLVPPDRLEMSRAGDSADPATPITAKPIKGKEPAKVISMDDW